MQWRACLRFSLAATLLVVAPLSPSRADDQIDTQSEAVEAGAGDPASMPLNPEQARVAAIVEEGQRQVAEIVLLMEGLPQGPALEELQARIVQVKTDTYVQMLTTTAEFARVRGDEPAALEAEGIIEQIRNQNKSQDPAVPQPSEKPIADQGGQQ